ncbi:MAG: hypothetical protein KatS3mg045_1913 [Bellilinea sp.]|nr:MAG: hypothetical protein KatS3mg045_1913 [Bellilinea sp.]
MDAKCIFEFWKNCQDAVPIANQKLCGVHKPTLARLLGFEHAEFPATKFIKEIEENKKLWAKKVKGIIIHAHSVYGLRKSVRYVSHAFIDAVLNQSGRHEILRQCGKSSDAVSLLVDASFLPDDAQIVLTTLPIEILYMSNHSQYKSCMSIKSRTHEECVRNAGVALAPGSFMAYAYRQSKPRIKYWRMLVHAPLEDIKKGRLTALMFMRQYPRTSICAVIAKEIIERMHKIRLDIPMNKDKIKISLVRHEQMAYIDPFSLRISRRRKRKQYTFVVETNAKGAMS